jgi:hypothetical protein
VAKKRAKRPIFEGDMPPQKMYPENWRQYWRHNRNPVKALTAAFNLLPVLRNGFAAAGFFNASVSSSKAVDALSTAPVVGMLYFSGKNTTVSETLVPLVFGI